MNDRHTSRFAQTGIYIRRCFRLFKNEKGWKNFVTTGLITLLICMVTGEDFLVEAGPTEKGAFAIMSACIWSGIFNSIRSVCRERSIVKREHRTGLHISSYVAAHWIYEAIICLGEAVIVTVIIYIANRTHFTDEGIFLPAILEYFISFFLILLSADALGLLISSVVRNENTAMTVMPFALIIQLIMSGMIFELEGLTDKISLITISRWGQAALCITARYNDTLSLFQAEKELYEMTAGNLMKMWFFLIFFAVLYGVIATIALEFVDRDQR